MSDRESAEREDQKNQAVDQICNHFKKLSSGDWECMATIRMEGSTATLDMEPGDILSKGDKGAGADWASWLDQHCYKVED